jgi:hypothetical protein
LTVDSALIREYESSECKAQGAGRRAQGTGRGAQSARRRVK